MKLERFYLFPQDKKVELDEHISLWNEREQQTGLLRLAFVKFQFL